MANAFVCGWKIAVNGYPPFNADRRGLPRDGMRWRTPRPHASQRLLQQDLFQTVMMGAAVSLGDMDPQQRRAVLGALGAGAEFGIILPFSRDHES